MIRNRFLAISILLLSLLLPALSQAQSGRRWDVVGKTLVVYSGTTMEYSVDTAPDSGLVNTRIPVPVLQAELQAAGLKMPGKKRIVPAALPPLFHSNRESVTRGVPQRIDLFFTAGQRTPDAEIRFTLPKGLHVTPDNTTVNIIGRGEVTLRNLPDQYMGRTGGDYPYTQVATYSISERKDGTRILMLKGVDLRPDNGTDVILTFHDVLIRGGKPLTFSVSYTASAPEVLHSPEVRICIPVTKAISDLYKCENQEGTVLKLSWTHAPGYGQKRLLSSRDGGVTWREPESWSETDDTLLVEGMETGKWHAFKLETSDGIRKHASNVVWHHAGMIDVKEEGIPSDGTDCTEALNRLIAETAAKGGATLYFPAGEYAVRTIRLQSNIWLHLAKDAVIKALPGADEPEKTWFSDRDYRSGLSPTDPKPYRDPENYLTKQDVGHTFFHNAMFRGERISNVKITGTGRITGNGMLATSDKVMNNVPGRRADKMFSFKLCSDIEIGGTSTGRDMWYDPLRDAPYYIVEGNGRDYDDSGMLKIDQGGHFVLLATGTDGLFVHDTYFGKYSTANARDIYDFMACSDVRVENIFSRVSSDDIVKPGSDCSLGFTRKARGYYVRNIVGDTNCNLFQIGSETADDIEDVYVDNIYVLGANKAGFSISTNDGGHIRNVYLNSGKTGPLHSRSMMFRTRAPFFISISNRGRVLGADVGRFSFEENGTLRDELLVTNVSIGKIENIHLAHLDIVEVYGGSSFKTARWAPYDGSQNKATPIFAGYGYPSRLADGQDLPFCPPDGRTIGYIEGLYLEDITLTVQGGNPAQDKFASPPELGVGRYNVGDLKTQPSYGFWFRHVKDLRIDGCTLGTETPDGRWPVLLDDVIGARISGLVVNGAPVDDAAVKAVRSTKR